MPHSLTVAYACVATFFTARAGMLARY